MKSSKKALFVFGYVFTLLIGFFIGISVDYPKVDDSLTAGTISRVSNYRNSNVSEDDIQLQNTLISDTAKLRRVQEYLRFRYITTAKIANNIDFSIEQANAVVKFKSLYKNEIEKLAGYNEYLKTVRPDILVALDACEKPDKTDPALFMAQMNQFNNVIAQISYRNIIVLDFIDLLDSYIRENKNDSLPGLIKSHDLLLYNELNLATVLQDKILRKFFEKKGFITKGKVQMFDASDNLYLTLKNDLKKLGIKMDIEQLGRCVCCWLNDSEKLENSKFFSDAEKLGGGYPDAEKLGTGSRDSEKMGIVNDSEKLGRYI